MSKHRVRLRRATDSKYGRVEPSGSDEECDAESRSQVLPRLAGVKKGGRSAAVSKKEEPLWMREHMQWDARTKELPRKTKAKARPHKLTLLDEQMLILCRSAMQRSWGLARERATTPPKMMYEHEGIYAAMQIQRVVRGFWTRRRLAAFDGPVYQRAARHIQFALRRVVVARRIWKRWVKKRDRCATRIQAWYRGCRCRDQLACERARTVVQRVILLQRRFRGYRFWNLVAELLARRRNNAATEIQRCCRGLRARRRVQHIKEERLQFSLELYTNSQLHRTQSRCKGCSPESCTEVSLFGCFMSRYIGLHDFAGAKQLGQEGVAMFPASSRFAFMHAVLLQAMGEDLEISMAYLRRAQITLALADSEIAECEHRFLFPALQLCKDDIAVIVDLAIVSQCSGKIARAESFYRFALSQCPDLYAVPGYLNRVDMVDRLLLNYHRFCSVFSSRQINVLAKVIPIAKRGEQIRAMVAKLNHYTVIYPADERDVCRFNAVYLSDDEVIQLLTPKHDSEEDGADINTSAVYNSSTSLSRRDTSTWKNASRRGSMRRTSKPTSFDLENAAKTELLAQRKHTLVLLYQSEFRGLLLKPAELSALSASRSNLRLTRELAERLLKEIMIIDPNDHSSTDTKSELNATEDTTPHNVQSGTRLHRIIIVPSILRTRMLRVRDVTTSHAILNIQRVFRGFQVRAHNRREFMLQSLQQRQVDELYARLHRNYMLREKRRLAAIAIQRIRKGYTTRKTSIQWRIAAIDIQRVFRGYRGRKRAIAFRDGNLTFYMAERVFQRGITISGRSVMLVVERCGLSYRLEAYDLLACTMYPGFVSRASSMGLVRYENWSYAQALCGREFQLHGQRAVIKEVAFINQDDCQCVMNCEHLQGMGKNASVNQLVTHKDCIRAINLRNASTRGHETELLPMPLDPDDDKRLVSCLLERLILIPALSMATKELKKKTPGSLILAVLPPPRMHYTYSKTATRSIQLSQMSTSTAKSEAELSNSMNRQLMFPAVDGYRGISVGRKKYRRKCTRHGLTFVKCRCVLPLVSTPAYIEAITLALTPPPPPGNLHTSSPLADVITRKE